MEAHKLAIGQELLAQSSASYFEQLKAMGLKKKDSEAMRDGFRDGFRSALHHLTQLGLIEIVNPQK